MKKKGEIMKGSGVNINKYSPKQLGVKVSIIKRILGYCPCPHCNTYFTYPKTRRMSSSYENDIDNYCYECNRCFEITEDYWKEMWANYNSYEVMHMRESNIH